MTTTTLILGESGTGKTTSLRNLSHKDTFLIQAIPKPLPFRSSDWKRGKEGNVWVSDDARKICEALLRCPHPIIVIDDLQYIMSNAFMRRVYEKGFEKFNDIARDVWDIFMCANALTGDKRVYLLAHSETSDDGHTSMKTLGKLLRDKITLEGLVTICLNTQVIDGRYSFATQSNGFTPCKSPIGMFDSLSVDNDLAMVDRTICDYYGITNPQMEKAA